MFDRLRLAIALALFGVAAVGLAACGRAGAPLPPPGPAVEPAPTAQATPPVAPSTSLVGPLASGPNAQETAQKNGFDANGNPVAPTGQKKSFPLDFLLQ